MTATLDPAPIDSTETEGDDRRRPVDRFRRWLATTRWRRFTPLQLLVLALAATPLVIIAGTVGGALVGLVTEATMVSVALGAGEDPGMVVFAAMFLASPVQWLVGRSQVRVRKYLGLMFYLLAVSNAAMFVVEQGAGAMLSAPFLVAGTLALALATPLALTSSRWSQRFLGMRRWRSLHRLTYVIAVALVGHTALLGEFDIGSVLIVVGLVARLPVIRRWLSSRRQA